MCWMCDLRDRLGLRGPMQRLLKFFPVLLLGVITMGLVALTSIPSAAPQELMQLQLVAPMQQQLYDEYGGNRGGSYDRSKWARLPPWVINRIPRGQTAPLDAGADKDYWDKEWEGYDGYNPGLWYYYPYYWKGNPQEGPRNYNRRDRPEAPNKSPYTWAEIDGY